MKGIDMSKAVHTSFVLFSRFQLNQIEPELFGIFFV